MQTIDNHIKLAIFMGQSNMAGRGEVDKSVICAKKAGFEFRACSSPSKLYPISEPFGYSENNPNEIDDGQRKSGGMVSAVIETYYQQTKNQVVAVSACEGGTDISQWGVDSERTLVYDAVKRLEKAKEFLNEHKIKIDNIFMVWCQGESDGDKNTRDKDYIKHMTSVWNVMKKAGVEKCFMVQIGHYNYLDYPHGDGDINGEAYDKRYEIIRKAQEEMCENDSDFILAGSFEPHIKNMKDRYHYYQKAYNEVGKVVGESISKYYNVSK